MNGRDLVLLLHVIDKAGRVEGRKRLQKIVCIAKTEYKIPFTYHFKPYFYGPYSEELSDSIDSLRGAGLVEEERRKLSEYTSQYEYFVTNKGKDYIRNTENKLLDIISKIKQTVSELNS